MPLVHVSRGASLRELGLHARAEREDRSGLDLAETGPTERAALRVGLVADAIGQGDVVGAVRRLDGAREAVAALHPGRDSDRQRIRLGWVEAEVALVTGRAAATSSLPGLGPEGTVVTPQHYRAGTAHHLAKGLLFSGVVTRQLEPLDRAAVLAPPGLMWAVHLARADLGAVDAMARARAAWSRIVPPAHLAGEVAGAPGVTGS